MTRSSHGSGDRSTAEAVVAVVVRTKNRPLLLRRALASVLGQTFTDLVVVIVNDEAPLEPVQQVVDSFEHAAAGRVIVVNNKKSDGREAAMNVGIRATKSRYVAIHDDDDSWAPEFLERTVAHLDSSGDHAVAVRTELVFERVEGDVITVDRRETLAADKSEITLFEMLRRNYAPPISLLYRRDVHDSIGYYDASLPVLADWDFNLRLLSRFTVGFIDETLAFWHHRSNAQGDMANSVVSAQSDHLRFDTHIRDHYLRSDLAASGGLGFLLYFTELISRERRDSDERWLHLFEILKPVTPSMHGGPSHLEALVAQVDDLNRNLVVQNNRFVAQLETLSARIQDLEKQLAGRAEGSAIADPE